MSIKEDIEKVEEKVEKIEKQSYAMEFLSDYKKTNIRLFIIILVILTMWFATIGYLVYILNDIGTITTTQEVKDIDTIGGNVVNGDVNG